MVKQQQRLGTLGAGRRALRFSGVALFGPTTLALACGGRTLDTGSLEGYGGADSGAVTAGTAEGGPGNGSGSGSSQTSVSAETAASTDGGTTGGEPGDGSCDNPYNLNASMDRFSGVTSGPNSFSGACGGGGPEIFFTWEAPRTGSYKIHTRGSGVDTVISRVDLRGCSVQELECNDDVDTSGTAELVFSAQQGERLYFVLDSYVAAGSVEVAIEGRLKTPPCGDGAPALSGLGPIVNQVVPLDDSTLGDPTSDACNGGAPRIKFDWTAPSNGTFQLDTFGSNYDTVLVVRTVCEGPSGEKCNDDMLPSSQSGVLQAALKGQVFRVEVAAFGGSLTLPPDTAPIVMLNVSKP